MSRRLLIVSTLFLMVCSFLVGTWISHRSGGQGTSEGRKVLHYVDPMHPSYTSDKPGIAPDCGMPLVPVYADGSQESAGSDNGAAMPPGTVQLSPDQQQLIGVKIGQVEMAGGSQNLRLQGRVAPDELRTYVINATIDGWITGIGNNTTGSIVRKNEILGTFYSPEFLSAEQALIYALGSMDRSMNSADPTQAQKGQVQQFNVNLMQYRDSLRNLGMGDVQIADIIRTRKYNENINIASPGAGLVLSRNISAGQRFERGRELYRITDISRVWVYVDTYGSEVDHVKPGTKVRISIPNRAQVFNGVVSKVPPTFDPATRTLRIRVEVDNPGNILRPDMFVDCELPVKLPSMISVPTEALVDSGLKKVVFIEKKTGVFEPREIETGASYGGRVEVTSGLKAGERIAISGTFLLDSESRMKTTAAGITSTPQLDPVCGMYVDEARAQAAGLTAESGGKTYYFCSAEDKKSFLKNPAVKKPMTMPAMQQGAKKPVTDHKNHTMPGMTMPNSDDGKAGKKMPAMAAPATAPAKMTLDAQGASKAAMPAMSPMQTGDEPAVRKAPMSPPAAPSAGMPGMKHD
ncbi:MAG: efflux RND transporter periplasmic adaptor subunit [Desulfuromonadaceae bacterium]|nr:efflux RND transporter periplasmic adaptor subunit [Desulfuromonadaceae bacterium]